MQLDGFLRGHLFHSLNRFARRLQTETLVSCERRGTVEARQAAREVLYTSRPGRRRVHLPAAWPHFPLHFVASICLDLLRCGAQTRRTVCSLGNLRAEKE